jgi:hypothetical protein
MHRGAALVEVRPYRFEGAWPDKYFRSLSALEQAIFYFQVSSSSRELSVPMPAANVSVWEARDHAVRLPWRALRKLAFASNIRSVRMLKGWDASQDPPACLLLTASIAS